MLSVGAGRLRLAHQQRGPLPPFRCSRSLALVSRARSPRPGKNILNSRVRAERVPTISSMTSARLLTRPRPSTFIFSKLEFCGDKSVARQTVLRGGALDFGSAPAPALGCRPGRPRQILFLVTLIAAMGCRWFPGSMARTLTAPGLVPPWSA